MLPVENFRPFATPALAAALRPSHKSLRRSVLWNTLPQLRRGLTDDPPLCQHLARFGGVPPSRVFHSRYFSAIRDSPAFPRVAFSILTVLGSLTGLGARFHSVFARGAFRAGSVFVNKDQRTFDIFRTLPDGTPLWLEAVQGLEDTRKRLIELERIAPDKYRVYDARENRFVDLLGKTA